MIEKKISSYFLNWRYVIGFAIGIFFLVLSFYNLDYNQIKNNIFEINYLYLFISTVFLVLTVYFRALRWKLLLKENIASKILFEFQFISYFGNNIFPLKFGEIIKTFLLSKNSNLSKSFIFGTVILEKFLDCIGMLMIAFIIFYYNLHDIKNFKWLILIIFLLSIFGIIVSYFYKKSKNHHSNDLISIINQVIEGFSAINKSNILLSLLYTFLIWIIYIGVISLVFTSMNQPLSFEQSIVILFLTTIPFLIPSTPANIGVFELIVKSALISVLDLSPERAVVLAVILHLSTFAPYTIIGGYYFIKNYLFNDLIIKNDNLES